MRRWYLCWNNKPEALTAKFPTNFHIDIFGGTTNQKLWIVLKNLVEWFEILTKSGQHKHQHHIQQLKKQTDIIFICFKINEIVNLGDQWIWMINRSHYLNKTLDQISQVAYRFKINLFWCMNVSRITIRCPPLQQVGLVFCESSESRE